MLLVIQNLYTIRFNGLIENAIYPNANRIIVLASCSWCKMYCLTRDSCTAGPVLLYIPEIYQQLSLLMKNKKLNKMNPLTQIRNTQLASKREIELGLDEAGSWHDRYKHSAYVYAGGLPFNLTEGDVLAVFSQYGEIVDVHLVRDKKTKKSRGFAFLAYEDQRSTVLAVDNLSGARVAGRTIRVEHVDNYRKKRAEVEGEEAPVPNDGAVEVLKEQEVARGRGDASVHVDVEEVHRNRIDNINVATTTTESKGGQVPSWRDLVAKREAALAEAKEKEKDEDGFGRKSRHPRSQKHERKSEQQKKRREHEKKRTRY